MRLFNHPVFLGDKSNTILWNMKFLGTSLHTSILRF
jgi:hypothetical protein